MINTLAAAFINVTPELAFILTSTRLLPRGGASSRENPIPPDSIHPVIFRIGSFAVRRYGVTYVVGYLVGAHIAERRGERGLVALTKQHVGSLIGYLMGACWWGPDSCTPSSTSAATT
jgi:hypothetical protein